MNVRDPWFPSPAAEANPCRFCAGQGVRTEYVGSRFLGTDYQAHAHTVQCWSCHGSGRAASSFDPQEAT